MMGEWHVGSCTRIPTNDPLFLLRCRQCSHEAYIPSPRSRSRAVGSVSGRHSTSAKSPESSTSDFSSA